MIIIIFLPLYFILSLWHTLSRTLVINWSGLHKLILRWNSNLSLNEQGEGKIPPIITGWEYGIYHTFAFLDELEQFTILEALNRKCEPEISQTHDFPFFSGSIQFNFELSYSGLQSCFVSFLMKPSLLLIFIISGGD